MSVGTAPANRISAGWIAVDWGTSNLRVWAMSTGGQVLASAGSDRGMGRLQSHEFEPALLDLIAPWLTERRMPVVACGMVGARQGWVEAPYITVPGAAVSAAQPIAVPTRDSRLQMYILPGLMQENPADVMRGEETQIAGFAALHPDHAGPVCLPGTHSKWVHLVQGRAEGFTTFMTGEQFALLSEHSVLRHSLNPGAEAGHEVGHEAGEDGSEEAGNDALFLRNVRLALAAPDQIAAQMFSIRARDLVHGQGPGAARARLSGLLIGAELAATRSLWQAAPVALIGATALSARYRLALETAGTTAGIYDASEMTLAGLTAAWNDLKGRI